MVKPLVGCGLGGRTWCAIAVNLRLCTSPRRVAETITTEDDGVVNAYHARNRVAEAINVLLRSERRAPGQVHEHVMSRQLVLKLRATVLGKKSQELASLV